MHQKNLDLKFFHGYEAIFGFLVLDNGPGHGATNLQSGIKCLANVQNLFWMQSSVSTLGSNRIPNVLPTKQSLLFLFFFLKGFSPKRLAHFTTFWKKALPLNKLICKFLISFVHF